MYIMYVFRYIIIYYRTHRSECLKKRKYINKSFRNQTVNCTKMHIPCIKITRVFVRSIVSYGTSLAVGYCAVDNALAFPPVMAAVSFYVIIFQRPPVLFTVLTFAPFALHDHRRLFLCLSCNSTSRVCESRRESFATNYCARPNWRTTASFVCVSSNYHVYVVAAAINVESRVCGPRRIHRHQRRLPAHATFLVLHRPTSILVLCGSVAAIRYEHFVIESSDTSMAAVLRQPTYRAQYSIHCYFIFFKLFYLLH